MALFMSKLMSGIVELLIVSVIPFITWLIWSRKKVGFFDWIGLKKVESQQKSRLLLTIFGYQSTFSSFFNYRLQLVRLQPNSHSSFFWKGTWSPSSYLGLCYLRDCLARRNLLQRFSFEKATRKTRIPRCQSGSVSLIWPHPCTYVYPNNWLPKAMAIMAFISLIAYVFGAINEKKAGGSILPSIFIHALANTVVGLLFAFSLIQIKLYRRKLSWMN